MVMRTAGEVQGATGGGCGCAGGRVDGVVGFVDGVGFVDVVVEGVVAPAPTPIGGHVWRRRHR